VSALLIYRLAVGAVAMQSFSVGSIAPTLALVLAGSLALGLVLSRLVLFLTAPVEDVPTAVILQFISTFGVWIVADRLGLSSVLTMVCFAIAVARRAPALTPARLRVPSYAVWETSVFVLNVLAFVFIGLQIRPIVASLEPAMRQQYFAFAVVVFLVVVVARVGWVLLHTGVVLWKNRRFGFRPSRRVEQPPTLAGSLVVAWAGMRGIITLAAALALPVRADGAEFPYRGLIVLTAFAVVIGTLVVQGLTLKPLIRALRLQDDDPVGREVEKARHRALEAALGTLDGDGSPPAEAVRLEFSAHLGRDVEGPAGSVESIPTHDEIHLRAVSAARRAVLDMRDRDEIGDDAFHRLEEELDRIEIGIG
jgi:monovalent cation/hydrogen antiporter